MGYYSRKFHQYLEFVIEKLIFIKIKSMNIKAKYLLDSLIKKINGNYNHCPNCGFSNGTLIESKFYATSLLRCDKCKLLYRVPITTIQENYDFYQSEYSQGFTTKMPSQESLKLYLKNNFRGTDKDYTQYLNILKSLGAYPGQKLLDYGCSWGYGSWQFLNYGYQVTAFEISEPRCQYAQKKLGINAKHSIEEIEGEFDIIFSSHVVEHLPNVGTYLEYAMNKLKTGGLLITICPNGSQKYRSCKPNQYKKSWGLVHPQLLDEEFYFNFFGENILIDSSPYNLDFL